MMVLHQMCSFVGSINMQYDDQFAKDGAKIGDSVKIRLPNEYTDGTGATITPSDTTESTVTLTVGTQRWVSMSFLASEMALSMDTFTDRVIRPAMARLAAKIEADAFSMYKDVYNQVSNLGADITFRKILEARQKLTDNLAPDDMRRLQLCTKDNLNLVDAQKGLFHGAKQLEEQYRKGLVADDTVGFGDIYENTLIPRHTSGTDASAYLVNGASQTGTSLIVDTGTGTLTKGDVITIAGVNRVHSESKADTGELQQFVIAVAHGGGAGTLTISPAITPTGASQNVTASPADNAAITKVGGNGVIYNMSLAYHRDAFAIAFVDLPLAKSLEFSGRVQQDGMSLRFNRGYDITTDKFISRIDAFYGYKTIRPQLAARSANN